MRRSPGMPARILSLPARTRPRRTHCQRLPCSAFHHRPASCGGPWRHRVPDRSITAIRDGNLSLEEFAGLWHEATRPLTVRAFQMLDTDGDAVVTRAEYDRPLAGIVERLDRDRDGGLSLRDSRHDDDDRGGWWDDD